MKRFARAIWYIPVILGLFFCLRAAWAAVTPNSIVTAQSLGTGHVVQFLQATDNPATYKTLYSAGANGSRINGLWTTNNDGSATHLVTCQLVNSAVKYGGTSLTTVSNAGFANATPAQNLLASWVGLPVDSDGNPFIQMISGDTLQCTYATTLTAVAGTVINIVASPSDF